MQPESMCGYSAATRALKIYFIFRSLSRITVKKQVQSDFPNDLPCRNYIILYCGYVNILQFTTIEKITTLIVAYTIINYNCKIAVMLPEQQAALAVQQNEAKKESRGS